MPAPLPALELLAGFPLTVYVADSKGFAIRKVSASGVVTTFAGTLGSSGFVDGTGAAARFSARTNGVNEGIGGLAMDGAGNVYVADGGNNAIRKITPQGVVTTLAGGGAAGSNDGQGSEARFDRPWAIAVDAQGNVYVGEEFAPRIRKISPAGAVTTIAGGAEPGMVDGPAAVARFGRIAALAADASGNLYISDGGNYKLRKLGIDGNVTTLPVLAFALVTAIAVDDAGVLYVRGIGVQKILPSGEITRISELGSAVYGIAVAKDGRVYYTDWGTNTIYQIAAAGGVTPFAGAAPGLQAQVDGAGTVARFENITAMAASPAGELHIIDGGSIRKVTRAGAVTTRVSGLGNLNLAGLAADEADATYYALWTYCGLRPNPGCANHSTLEKLTPAGQRIPILPAGSSDGTPLPPYEISGLTRDSGGNLYLANLFDALVLKQAAAGDVTTIAGGPPGYADGIGTAARFSRPTGLALDVAGNLYVADTGNNSIRKIAPDRRVTTLVAGPNLPGAANAGLSSPRGVAVDESGNVYVADTGNNVVRKVTPAGAMSIIAGQSGQAGFAPGSLPGSLDTPVAVAVVGTDLYIAMPGGIAVVRNRP
jgi:sugar lactone lactonase YvrE